MRLFPFLSRRERGQVIMIAAVLFPVVLGMAGMAVDIGSYASERRTLQNAADSIALAAAQELPNEGLATAAGHEWAKRNNIPLSELDLQFSGDETTTPKVRAVITTQHEFAFMGALGISSRPVAAKAAAIKASFAANSGIVPWTVTQATIDASPFGHEVILKYDADGADIGNFGAIQIDGSGSFIYGDSVKYGTDNFACAVSATNCTTTACPGTPYEDCAESSPACDGPECPPKTGNVIGDTRVGVDFRMDYTMPECDTFEEVFSAPDPDTGKSTIDPDCNPWTDGAGACTSDTDLCSRRVIIIPVIDSFGSGSSDPGEIQRFALLFLEGYDSGKCQGSDCEIKGRFVMADINTDALAGTYDPGASIHFTKLSE